MDNVEIQSILHTLGERVPPSSPLVPVGGSALALLGSPRQTIDIDFVGDDVNPSELDKTIMKAAKELKLYIEPVDIERFLPLPEGSNERNIRIVQFGNLEVYVADPYSIALSKLDRGFDTDLDDIVFLVQRKHVNLEELERITRDTLPRARQFDINPTEMLARLQTVRERLM